MQKTTFIKYINSTKFFTNFEILSQLILYDYTICILLNIQNTSLKVKHTLNYNHMDYLSNIELINKVSESIIQSKQTTYNDDPIYQLLQILPSINMTNPIVYNKYKEKLKVTLFYHYGQQRKTCIVFMHGFGSNRLQAINILPQLPINTSLCCFDFSGEGKSQGNKVTYGLKEKDDIRAIIGFLRSCKYDKFILWGRSMGATSALLYSIHQKPSDVVLQILDSPYSSFSEVAMQLTKKKINVPEVILGMALDILKKNYQKKQYNPFRVNLNYQINCPISTVFVYSENDDVVSHRNSLKIINNFKGHYEKIIIKENHNVIRTARSIKTLTDVIKKYTLRKKINLQNNFNNVRLLKQQIITEPFDHYGIWVSSKFSKKPNNSTSQVRNLNQSYSFLEEKLKQKSSRPKSSIKVFSANFSLTQKLIVNNNEAIDQSEINDKKVIKLLSQSTATRSTSQSVNYGIKRMHHLSHELYL